MGHPLLNRNESIDEGIHAVVASLDRTAAPLHAEAKDRWFYHGTSSQKAADAILTEGIQPPNPETKSRAQMAPAHGRIYITPNLGYAAIYALGANMFGHAPWKDFDRNGEYGYIFALRGEDLAGDLVPDEDSIGSMLSSIYALDKAKQRLAEAEQGNPRWNEAWQKDFKRTIEHESEKPINQPGAESVRSNLKSIAEQVMTDNQRKKVLNGNISGQAGVGKKVQPRLSALDIQWMLDHGAHAAHLGMAHPVKAWRFKKTDAESTTEDDVLSIAEEVPLPLNKTAAPLVLKRKTMDPTLKQNLKAFLDEVLGATSPNPFNPRERLWENKAVVECSEWEGKIDVATVRSLEKGEGHGSAALQWLCNLADRHQVPMALDPKPFGDQTLNKTDLTAWYGRYGFKKKQGEGMVREPDGVPDPKLAYNEDAWNDTRNQYEFGSPTYTTPKDEQEWKQRGDRRHEWDQSALAALSLGKITPADARARDLHVPDVSVEDFKPLPQHLYHVTTAASKVFYEGLKTRYELVMMSGTGLGGGTDKAISFTDDLSIARGIYHAVIQAHTVLNGKLTIPEMIARARSGAGADKPWIEEIVGGIGGRVLEDGTNTELERLERGMMVETAHGKGPEDMPGWTPRKHSYHWTGGDGIERYLDWERPMTEEEKTKATFAFFKTWSYWREHAGGAMDPLFFLTDIKALAAVDPEDIAILEYRPAPGAMGTHSNGLREWRTYSGKAVEFVQETRPGAKTAAEAVDPDWEPLQDLLKENYERAGSAKKTIVSRNPEIALFKDKFGSQRFVRYEDGAPVCALQIVVDRDTQLVANLYTAPEFRRRGFARELFQIARKRYPKLQHSKHLTEDGKGFADKNAAEASGLRPQIEAIMADMMKDVDAAFDTEDGQIKDSGNPWSNCTQGARHIINQVGRGEIWGYQKKDNPTAELADGDGEGGHDFAIIDDLLVDFWAHDYKDTPGIIRLSDKAQIAELYGDRALWSKGSKVVAKTANDREEFGDEWVKPVEQVRKFTGPAEWTQIKNLPTAQLPDELRPEAELTIGDEYEWDDARPLVWSFRTVKLERLLSEEENYDEDFEEYCEELARDIAKNGLRMPIIIGPNSVEGNHRVRALELLEWKIVPVLTSKRSPRKTAALKIAVPASDHAHFDRSQVKSAIGNSGEFNPEKTSITAAAFRWYHGTSKENGKQILAAGELRPGMERNSGGPAPQPDAVYITFDKVMAEQYAEGDGVIFEVRVDDPANLIPDEDSLGQLLDSGEINGHPYPDEIFDIYWRVGYEGDPAIPKEKRREYIRTLANETMKVPMFLSGCRRLARYLAKHKPEIVRDIIRDSGKAAHIGPVKVLRRVRRTASFSCVACESGDCFSHSKAAVNISYQRIDIEEDYGSVHGTVSRDSKAVKEYVQDYDVRGDDGEEAKIDLVKGTTVAFLKNIDVYPEHRGKGYGTKLLNTFLRRALDAGATACILMADVLNGNDFDLEEWYERHGFYRLWESGEGDPVLFMSPIEIKRTAKKASEVLKTAAHPETLYHSIEPYYREYIQEHGLIPKNYGRKGVYLATNAQQSELSEPAHFDHWEVNVQGLKVEPDPMGFSSRDEEAGTPWFVCYQTIAPNRLKLLTTEYTPQRSFSPKRAMKINVPESEHQHFWAEPPAGHEEFWAFRFKPKASLGDRVIFHMDKQAVAEAVISRIEPPGKTACEQTGRFGNRWKVFWSPESFRKLGAHTIDLYHGTCPEFAERLLRDGFTPGSSSPGANQGQSQYLYLTNEPENARWFSNEKGCETVLAVRAVPLSALAVDPEDGIGESVEEELTKPHGLPAYLVLKQALPSLHFHAYPTTDRTPVTETKQAAPALYHCAPTKIRQQIQERGIDGEHATTRSVDDRGFYGFRKLWEAKLYAMEMAWKEPEEPFDIWKVAPTPDSEVEHDEIMYGEQFTAYSAMHCDTAAPAANVKLIATYDPAKDTDGVRKVKRAAEKQFIGTSDDEGECLGRVFHDPGEMEKMFSLLEKPLPDSLRDVAQRPYAFLDKIEAYVKGKGTGKRLWEDFLRQAEQKGAESIILMTDRYNKQQRGFNLTRWYISLGFKKIVNVDGDWIMMKSIAAPPTVSVQTKRATLKSSEYPPRLPDGHAIAQYIVSIASDDVDEELMEDYFRGYAGVLREVPIASLHEGNPDGNIPSKAKERKYKKMDPVTIPPLVILEDEIQDGNHRYRVAKGAGAKTIWCYDLVDEDEPQAKQAAMPRHNNAQVQTLREIDTRAGDGFMEWLQDLIGDDTNPTFLEVWDDDESRLDYLSDWLQDVHSIAIEEHGYVEFWRLEPDVERLIGDLPVVVYHHTSSSVVPKIKREGLRADVKRINTHQNSGAGVYVTTELSGPAVNGYHSHAVQKNRKGGRPVTLSIKTYLSELEPDPDDQDIQSGATQYILPYVAPRDIIWEESHAKTSMERTMTPPLKHRANVPPEPWYSFLKELDKLVTSPTVFYCVGGFVVTVLYGSIRETKDIDVLEIVPQTAFKEIGNKADEGGELYSKYKVYLDHVKVAQPPLEWESRLVEMFPGAFKNIRLAAMDPYDIVLTKLSRNELKDREDAEYLARTIPLKTEVLRERYKNELREFVTNQRRDDLTLELWIAQFFKQ